MCSPLGVPQPYHTYYCSTYTALIHHVLRTLRERLTRHFLCPLCGAAQHPYSLSTFVLLGRSLPSKAITTGFTPMRACAALKKVLSMPIHGVGLYQVVPSSRSGHSDLAQVQRKRGRSVCQPRKCSVCLLVLTKLVGHSPNGGRCLHPRLWKLPRWGDALS